MPRKEAITKQEAERRRAEEAALKAARKKPKDQDSAGIYATIKKGDILEKVLVFRKVRTERVGYPPLELTDEGAEWVAKMSSFGCPLDDIAASIGVAKATFYNDRNREKTSQALIKGQAEFKNGLRRAQLQVARKGNPSMLIFLGKNYLGQTDHPEPAPNVVSPINDFVDGLKKVLEEGGE